MAEDKLRQLVGAHGFTIANLSSRLINEGKIFEYRMVIHSRDRANAHVLSQHLLSLPEVVVPHLTNGRLTQSLRNARSDA
jgi:putative Mg2+ transporter-C (MgtC) family protein